MKLPVFRAVGTTLAFTTQHWLDLLKIIWLPTVLMIGAYAVIMPIYATNTADIVGSAGLSPEESMAALGVVLPYTLLIMLVLFVYCLVVFAGILRLVIHGEKSRLPFYIGSGPDELRLLGTWLLYTLILFGLYIGLGVVVSITFLFGTSAIYAAGIVGIAAFFVFMWIGLRLSLVTPAAIGARTIGIGPSWNAAKGNVWRLFGYWLIWGLIFFAASFTFLLIFDPGFFQVVSESFQAGLRGEEPDMTSEVMTMTSVFDANPVLVIVRAIAGSLFYMIILSVWAVAAGVAWRLMTDDRPEKHFE